MLVTDMPIVAAPMAGGPSTPELAAAVSEVGGLGFVALALKTPEAAAETLAATRRLTRRPLGANLFCPPARLGDPGEVEAYAGRLCEAGHMTGEPRTGDDGYEAKLELLLAAPVEVVSFTFGSPEPAVVSALRDAGSEVWVTVTAADEAVLAAAAGADALVVQGSEAGGHQSRFVDDPARPSLGLLTLLQLVRAAVDLPLVAAGAIATRAASAAVLEAGAALAQPGTAFMLAPEAGTLDVHRAAIASPAPTELTRAYTGRLARGIVNDFMTKHSAHAPAAYPEVLYLTSPIRAHRDPATLNLWAGEAHALTVARPAAETARALAP
jgi:nitronate monooxygenase